MGAALLALLFVAGSFLPPLLTAAGAPGGELLERLYAPLCHQQASRSLPVGQTGHQAVCSRCSGLYFGGMLGLFLAAWLLRGSGLRLRREIFFIAATPTVIDVLLRWLGFTGLANFSRFAVAVVTGIVIGLFLAEGIADLFSSRNRARGVEPHTSAQLHGGN